MGGWLGAGWDQLAQQLLDAGVEVVADAAHHLDRLAGRVLELPVLIALARVDRAGIPQPMVTTTSAARMDSSVRGLGNSLDRSMPNAAMAAITAGLS